MDQIEGGYATSGDFYCCSLDQSGLVWFELDWFGLVVEGMVCFFFALSCQVNAFLKRDRQNCRNSHPGTSWEVLIQ